MKTYTLNKKSDVLDTAMDLIEDRFDSMEDNDWTLTGPVSRSGFLTQSVLDYLQFEISNGSTTIAMISLETKPDVQKESKYSDDGSFPISYKIRPGEDLLQKGDLSLYDDFINAWTSTSKLKRV